METSTALLNETIKPGPGIKKPLIYFALPLVLFLPTWWFFCRYVPEHSRISQRIGVEHMRVHWGMFWIITFFPFAGICFLSSLVMLIRRARHSPEARVALVPVGLFALGILVLIALIVSDFVR